MVNPIRIGIIDPYPIYRQGVFQTIVRNPDFSVIVEGGTAQDARLAALQSGLDILLLDISALNGDYKQLQELNTVNINLRIVILTAHDDILTVSAILGAGIQGYILKGVSGSELISALKLIYAGQPYITPELASQMLIQGILAPPAKELALLTSRERQVLDHVSTGLTNKEIAVILGLQIKTIKYYLTTAFKKLSVTNRVQAMKVMQSFTNKNQPKC